MVRGSQVPGKLKAIIAWSTFILIAFSFFNSTVDFEFGGDVSVIAAQLDNCADCHKKQSVEVLSLYSGSTHAKSKLTCNRCHGGDALATDKEKAHSGNFVGLPDPNQIISMCGSCHRAQIAMFKEGKHSVENQGKPRLDCSQCHGAHTVGSPTRNFSFNYFCAGCHGLEYLPELPPDFQQMLKLVDNIKDITAKTESSGRALTEEEIRTRREIRHRIAEIVHATDAKGGSAKIPDILRLGEEFRKSVGQK